jgi:hypothetical protein
VPWTDLADKGYEVSFPRQIHRFIKTDVLGVHRWEHVINPKYHFPNAEERDRFQSDFRERDLVGTYKTHEVTCVKKAWPRTGVTLAYGQFVKVWRPRNASQVATFTFRGTEQGRQKTSRSDEHFEYNLPKFILHSIEKLIVTLQANEEGQTKYGLISVSIEFVFETGMFPN